MKRVNISIWFLPVFVLVIDFTLKLLALNFLQFEQYVTISKNISLYLIYNRTPFNSFLINLGYANNVFLILGSLMYVVFGFSLLILPTIVTKKRNRILIYIIVEVLFSVILFNVVKKWKNDITIVPYVVSLLKNIGPLFVACILYIKINNRIYKYLWGLYLGAGLGNLCSLFYHPFAVIDYVYVNNNFNIGVFNFSDLIIVLSISLFIMYSILYFCKFIIHLIHDKINVSKSI